MTTMTDTVRPPTREELLQQQEQSLRTICFALVCASTVIITIALEVIWWNVPTSPHWLVPFTPFIMAFLGAGFWFLLKLGIQYLTTSWKLQAMTTASALPSTPSSDVRQVVIAPVEEQVIIPAEIIEFE